MGLLTGIGKFATTVCRYVAYGKQVGKNGAKVYKRGGTYTIIDKNGNKYKSLEREYNIGKKEFYQSKKPIPISDKSKTDWVTISRDKTSGDISISKRDVPKYIKHVRTL